MQNISPRAARAAAWSLTGIASLLAVYAWGSSLDWQFGELSIYLLFPLLGLLAFSIIWSQYMVSFLQRSLPNTLDLTRYFNVASYSVLALIILHPGLLAYQRWHDGFGLPPKSETSYVASGAAWIVGLAMISLLVLLAYELHWWFSSRPWWKYVVALGDLAVLTIFYHGLELGTQTHITWYRIIWWFYGITLATVMALSYTEKLRRLMLKRGETRS